MLQLIIFVVGLVIVVYLAGFGLFILVACGDWVFKRIERLFPSALRF
jgi:hypothetical protein